MVTAAHITKRMLQEKPFIHEALMKDLINIGALADLLKPDIENELGEKVKPSAISMAIRRYVEGNAPELHRRVKLTKKSELLVKSSLFEISLAKSIGINKKLIKLYEIVDFESGDTLNIIHGDYEILILSNEKYRRRFLEILKEERIKKVRAGISSVSIRIPHEYADVPGFYFAITKTLAMENIPIVDLVNTESEATIILNDRDISRAYDMLNREMTIEYFQKKKRA